MYSFAINKPDTPVQLFCSYMCWSSLMLTPYSKLSIVIENSVNCTIRPSKQTAFCFVRILFLWANYCFFPIFYMAVTEAWRIFLNFNMNWPWYGCSKLRCGLPHSYQPGFILPESSDSVLHLSKWLFKMLLFKENHS